MSHSVSRTKQHLMPRSCEPGGATKRVRLWSSLGPKSLRACADRTLPCHRTCAVWHSRVAQHQTTVAHRDSRVIPSAMTCTVECY